MPVWFGPALAIGAPFAFTAMSTVSAGLAAAELVGDDELEVQRRPDRWPAPRTSASAPVALDSVTWSGPAVTGSPAPSTWVHA